VHRTDMSVLHRPPPSHDSTVPPAPRRPVPPDARPAAAGTATPPPPPDAHPATAATPPAPATVTVRILPWCDITIDSLPPGRSPSAPPIALAPGHHTLVCAQPGVGGGATVELELAPGEKRTVERQLYGKVSVRVGVARVLRIDGRPVLHGETVEL